MRIALERGQPHGKEPGEGVKAIVAMVELATGVSARDELARPVDQVLHRTDIVTAALATCVVLASALVAGSGHRALLVGLLSFILIVMAAAELGALTERPGIRAGALLVAIVGAPWVAIAVALDPGAPQARTIVSMLVGFAVSAMLRRRVAIAMLLGTGAAITLVQSSTPEAWACPLAVFASGLVGLVRRAMTERIESEKDKLGRLMRSLAPRETLAATAEAAVSLIRDAGPFDVALLGAFTPDGGFRHLAHSSRLANALPVEAGALLPESRAAALRARITDGPWVVDWTTVSATDAYNCEMYAAGLRLVLYAPIVHQDAIIALLGVGYGKRTGQTQRYLRGLLFERMSAVVEATALLGAIMAPQLAELDDRDLRVGAMRALIDGERFAPVFQPIVELATGVVVGYEALTRFADGERPDRVFQRATDLGWSDELEAATLSAAIVAGNRLEPRDAWLSLNMSPGFVIAGRAQSLLAGLERSLVVEITEHAAVDDYEILRRAVIDLGPDVSVAVDDAGSGYASLRHVLELRPRIVKLDIGLVRGVDTDGARQAAVAGLVHMAERSLSLVIAEGVETEEERAALLELRVYLGQGYLLGMPVPAPASLDGEGSAA